MPKLLDEDWGKARPSSARNLGYTGIIGYVSEDDTGKNLTASDVEAIHAVGLDVGLVYEYAPRAALQGAARGDRDANVAIQHALSIGAPSGVCLYVAVDFDVQDADLPAVIAYVRAYLSACNSARFGAGVYGGLRLMLSVQHAGLPLLLWQTYAWSGGVWAPGLNLRQIMNGVTVGGERVDLDESEVIYWGQWSPKGVSDVSVTTDNIVFGMAVGSLNTVKEDGTSIPVGPSQWERDRKVWQSTVDTRLGELGTAIADVRAAVASVEVTLSGMADGSAVLSAEESADLHTIAAALAKLTT